MKLLPELFLLGVLLAGGCSTAPETETFVRAENGQFLLDGKPYYFIGTNFWYGPILASAGEGGDRERLARELDALADCGITNLRVLVGADGEPGVTAKIEPTLQYAPGKYNDDLLDGLDFFLWELGKRGMKAVLYLNNSWEWSGGYSQYLAWCGAGEIPIPAVAGYRAYTEYVGRFIPDTKARKLFADHVRFIVGRTNRYSGLKYADDPAIFSWQIGNEPRPFGQENKEAFAQWIGETARLIRSLDPNHMISTGSEGLYGCESDAELTERIHAFPEIAYVNLHIWPYNWQWIPRDNPAAGLDNALDETDKYIAPHLDLAERLRKPVVIEEFGFPRDSVRFERGTPTTARDAYYASLLERIVDSKNRQGVLAGCNFWGWGGEARPAHVYWQRGDDYCGDPAQEQQGLNSVFDDDPTIAIIRDANARLK
ncbi:beta-mannosidase [uncultured Alistipes sp.]|uniref:glycoside hydrolase 5 family protein n=1 Tax=uncultured Alistipes sp. TaxID=538949 RepID=UPI002622252C|nr:beta-mannosidase [uncultured Alistipes sp.]